MNLYLMQHARPVPKEEDPSQPLSPEGVRDAETVGSWLARISIRPEVIFHSPKERAKQTAREVAKRLPGSVPLEERSDLTPMADPAGVEERLKQMEGDVMIVGHMPHLARLATRLLTGGRRDDPGFIAFVQGTVLCLTFQDGLWKVAWMMPPHLLLGA